MEKLESTLAQIDENVKKITFFLLLRLQSARTVVRVINFKLNFSYKLIFKSSTNF